MEEITSRKDALVEALYLAVLAPGERQMLKAAKLAEQIAAGLSELEVAQAKRDAEERIEKFYDEPPF